jgi:hypothetical protein
VKGTPAPGGRSVEGEPGTRSAPPIFSAVEAIGRTLPEVEVTTAWGKPALKTRGRMFVCLACAR